MPFDELVLRQEAIEQHQRDPAEVDPERDSLAQPVAIHTFTATSQASTTSIAGTVACRLPSRAEMRAGPTSVAVDTMAIAPAANPV